MGRKKITDKQKADAAENQETMGAGLTDKQEAFCNEYLVDLNATQAAKRAKYSEDSAGSIGHELLKKPEIQHRIEQLREETGKGFNITRERVAQEYARIAYSDIGSLVNAEGGIKNIAGLPADVTAAISSVEVFEEFETLGFEKEKVGETKKLKLWDKVKALDSLCKLMGYNAPTRTELTGKGGGPLDMVPLTINVVHPERDEDLE